MDRHPVGPWGPACSLPECGPHPSQKPLIGEDPDSAGSKPAATGPLERIPPNRAAKGGGGHVPEPA
jgi:hypothetical protein